MDFDDAKENIQPLATGRKASILKAVLNVDMQDELLKQRESLENAISQYKGNDPLEPWFEYVSWIEQSYPSGGSESGFKKVLVKCLENFETNERYFQDIRLIRIYIKFIDSEDNPQELYQELFNAGIGTMVADFYICWAYYYDVIGNFKKADMIFRKGIELRAEPYETLIEAHRNFGFTMSQRMLYQDEKSKVEFLSCLQERRQALTSLRGSNIGSIRHENHTQSRKVQNSSEMIKHRSKKEHVIEDSPRIGTVVDIESSKSIIRNIIECKRMKENNREPGPWSKESSKKNKNIFKVSNLNDDLLGFTILEDDLSINLDSPLNDQKNNFKHGIKLPTNFVSKNYPQEIWELKTVLGDGIMSKGIPAYRKNYHYPKIDIEFSMEEYLAYKWFKKRNITNLLLENCNRFWGDEYSVGIRLYPNFVSKSLPNNDNSITKQENLTLSENVILAVKYNKLYPNGNTEMQFEEILAEKWYYNSNLKQKYNNDKTIITAMDVDETLSTIEILPEKQTSSSIRKSNIQQPTQIPFLIYKDEINNFNPLESDFERGNVLTDLDYLAPNETCSTKQFNLFLKTQSVSTPIRNPINAISQNDENTDKNDFALSTSVPLAESSHIFPIKQLSTILETSETNAARKSSVDTHSSNSDFDGQECSKMQLFIEPESNKKSVLNLVKNQLFETETNFTITGNESCNNVDVFKQGNTRTNLSFNPINFFEERTENITEGILHRRKSLSVNDTEMFKFLAKTPEKKCTTILNESRNQIDDYTIKNHSIKFPNFEDFEDNQNIYQGLNISDDLLNSEKCLMPISFPKYQKTPAHMNKLLISPYKNHKIKSKENFNCSIWFKNIFKGNFASEMYSVINRNKEGNILNKNTLKGNAKRNYEEYNFSRLKNFINKSIINNYITQSASRIFDVNVKSNEEKCFNLEYKILGILGRSELIRQPSVIDMNKKYISSQWLENLSPENFSSIFKDIKIEAFPQTFSTVNYFRCLPNYILSQRKLLCMDEQKFVLSGTLSTMDRFSVVPFENNKLKRDSIKYLRPSIYCVTTDRLKKKTKEELNLNQTIEYIADQVRNVDINPFSLDLIESILQKVDFYSYIKQLESCKLVEKNVYLKKGSTISINNFVIEVINRIGEGAYGTVFCGQEVCTGKQFAMKQEKPANLWEYYICLELRNRLQNANILFGFMDIQYALIGNNASVLITELSPYGSLIAVYNKIKLITTKNMNEYVVMVLISQILSIIDHLHASEIIHADIKAENFLLMRKLKYGSKTPSIQLIDFGVSIDLKQFPRGQEFTFAHTSEEFQCVEMRENRSWSFQIDLYGVATIIHILLFGKYLEIHKLTRGWTLKHHMPRYLNKTIWDKIFSELINIRDENSMPNLQDLRVLLEQEILEKEKYVKEKILEFNKAIDAM